MRPPVAGKGNSMNTRFGFTHFPTLDFGFAAFLLIALLFSTSARTQSATASIAAPTAARGGMLDDRQFKAGIVRIEEDQDEEKKPLGDQLTFSNGMFSSAVCKRYNFKEAPYWVRVEGEKTHFLAELTSPTDGRMLWKGTIQGNTLEGTMRWTKKRWYWTIDTEHRIRGELDKGASNAAPSAK